MISTMPTWWARIKEFRRRQQSCDIVAILEQERIGDIVERIDASPDYMESERVGRYKDLKLSTRAFVDAQIPGYERDILSIIGRGVVEDKDIVPPITDNRDFNIGIIPATPARARRAISMPRSSAFLFSAAPGPSTGKIPTALCMRRSSPSTTRSRFPSASAAALRMSAKRAR